MLNLFVLRRYCKQAFNAKHVRFVIEWNEHREWKHWLGNRMRSLPTQMPFIAHSNYILYWYRAILSKSNSTLFLFFNFSFGRHTTRTQSSIWWTQCKLITSIPVSNTQFYDALLTVASGERKTYSNNSEMINSYKNSYFESFEISWARVLVQMIYSKLCIWIHANGFCIIWIRFSHCHNAGN